MAWIDPRPKPLQLWLDLDASIDMIEIIPPPDAFSGCNPWNIQMIDDLDRREFIKGGAVALSAATMLRSESAAAQNASSNVVAPQPAVVFYNGDILTMEGDAAAYVEAVAIKDGKIAFAGSKKEALVAVDAASLIDLKGHTLLPGFIDAWGHFTLVAQETLGVNLAYFSEKPPHNKAELIERLKEGAPFNGWIIGFGYVESFLSDGAPTLEDLDLAFPDTPVLIGTLSTLTGKVNSAGIRKLGLTPQTKAIQPGVIVKDAKTGNLTGDLMFMPFLAARAAVLGAYPQEIVFKTFRAAEKLLVRQGYTTAQTYQLTVEEITDLRAAFDRDVISLDIIGLPSVSDEASGKMVQFPDWTWGRYSHGDRGLKVPGFLVPTDAAPQLRLAAFTRPYLDTTGFPNGWNGDLFPREPVERWVKYAYENDIQLFGYSNGDAGIDLQLSAIEKAIAATGKTGDRRTIIGHSYFVRDDQLELYKNYHVGASMFPMHQALYGETLIGFLGLERASRECPVASAVKKGINVTLHSDCPSVSPSVMDTIWSAVTRTTLSGRTLDPEERSSPYLALLAVTRNAAYTYREETTKGTITAGKIADLVILDGNPLTVAPEKIRDINVKETIKRGKTIYRQDQGSSL